MGKVKDSDTIESRMMNVRWADKHIINLLNGDAIKHKRNRSVTVELLEKLNEGVRYPAAIEMIHNDTEMRVAFFSPNTGMFWIDMSLENYGDLPVIEIADPTPLPC